MPDSARPLTREEILRYLDEVASELRQEGAQLTVIVVGGSLLALHGLREATADVDSMSKLNKELRDAAAVVAARHGLAPTWLNDRVLGFETPGIDEDSCDLIRNHPRLRILGAPLRDVFLMKLFAARTRDVDDLVALWPESGFASPQEAVDALYAAYPHEEPDPNLTAWLADKVGFGR